MSDDPRQKMRRILRLSRRVVMLVLAISVAWFFWRYDFLKIPDDYPHLTPQRMPPGSHVIAVNCDDSTNLGVGSVVLYAPPDHADQRCFGVIAGVPGEVIQLERDDSRMATLIVGGRRERLRLPDDPAVHEGEIPAGHYLILNGDRHLQPANPYPDSRILGLIPRRNILKKLARPIPF